MFVRWHVRSVAGEPGCYAPDVPVDYRRVAVSPYRRVAVSPCSMRLANRRASRLRRHPDQPA